MVKEVVKLTPRIFKLPKIKKIRVAAYARVSTEKDEQHNSLEVQKAYFTKYIKERNDWQFAGLYYDDGISGLSRKNRDGFNRLIEDALQGKIDLIVTKSISRFARNTLDTISTIRKLKGRGIGVFFQKENIHTLDSKSEFVLTLMSSFAQEESRSISENCTWGQRKRFADGKVTVPFTRFLGYDRGEHGELIINKEEAKIVEFMYSLAILGFNASEIKRELEANHVKTPSGLCDWSYQAVHAILTNEKYKGDALLQKSFTVNFLTKEKKKNEGELPKYYVENDHEAIISRAVHDYVQSISVSERVNKVSGISGKIFCAMCGAYFGRFRIHPEQCGGRVAWRCKNKWNKEHKCYMRHLYDTKVHESITRATFDVLKKRKDLIEKIANLTGLPSDKITRTINKVSASEFVGDYKVLETIIKCITVRENHDAGFTFIDGSKAKGHIEGTGKTKVKGQRNQQKQRGRPEPKHFDEFVRWLKEESGYAQSTIKSIRKRTRLAHSILRIKKEDGYVEILESKNEFRTLTKKVQDNVKYALKVYFRFIKKDEKDISCR